MQNTYNIKNIRDFCIIAHIDHGKSTLCDRLLDKTGTVEKRKLKEQILDQMDLERERGITIKLQPVQMQYQYQNKLWELNLIDTPGHVDFNYEVSRSLAAVEGAILLVDATQGIQAQTLANLYLALEENLTIIPAINKIDLPNAQIKETEQALLDLLGGNREEILRVSGKTGEGVEQILQNIIEKIPHPQGNPKAPSRALIFDSFYDPFKGVVAYIKVVDGCIQNREKILVFQTKKEAEIIELGILKPSLTKTETLFAGQIGYIATGLKDVKECRVGDTLMIFNRDSGVTPLKGYQEPNPMVFASFYPKEGDDYTKLRDALDKLSLNDASFVFSPESSKALGRGFRGGFLGLLHLEIIQERLRREFDLDLIFTIPSVEFEIEKKNQEKIKINSPVDLPHPSVINKIKEPFVKLEVITDVEYIGGIMEYLAKKRSIYKTTSYLNATRVVLTYETPLLEVITNLHDAIKTLSKGYASINYEIIGFRESDLVKLDILVARESKEELARIIPRIKAHSIGVNILKKLKSTLPKQNFVVALQAAIGGKIIVRENIKALRKDVLAKLYGGDRTRKDKLLNKQKKGKKKMETLGRVAIPTKAYMDIMKNES